MKLFAKKKCWLSEQPKNPRSLLFVISGNDIGDTGLEWLVQVLPDLPNLHTLNLEDNGITAQGFAYLVNLTVVCTSKSSLISLHSRPLLPGSSNVRSPHDIKRPLQVHLNQFENFQKFEKFHIGDYAWFCQLLLTKSQYRCILAMLCITLGNIWF